MQLHEFVFSQNKEIRLMRHFIFWVLWWLYFTFSDFLYQQLLLATSDTRPVFVTLGSFAIIKTLLLIGVYAVASYTFMYLLLPMLLQAKWLKTAMQFLLLSGFLFTATHLLYWYVFPLVDALFGTYKPNRFVTRYWPAVNLGLINPTKVIASVAIIKYVKRWWLKQKESEQLEREKIAAELQLLKAQIHPGFLFTSLNNIHDYAVTGSPHASALLLKLSDLLSYMLYECDRPLVPLQKEIAAMEKYMAMEKIRMGEKLEMELSIRGGVSDKMVAPFLLLPFIENSFTQSSDYPFPWINLDISLEENSFHMILSNGMRKEVDDPPPTGINGLTNIQKRLTLLYPQKHELKISAEQEMFIVHLKIQLGNSGASAREEEDQLFTHMDGAKPGVYAAP